MSLLLKPISYQKRFLSWFLMIALLVVLIIHQLPARWVNRIVADQTFCQVHLKDISGTIWQGSASLGIAQLVPGSTTCSRSKTITERFNWDLKCSLSDWSCFLRVEHLAFEKPLIISWADGRWRLANNILKISAHLLENLGSPWNTIKPVGQLTASWSDLELGQGGLGSLRIVMHEMSSPMSPVVPLGSYEIMMNMAMLDQWDLKTLMGPLVLAGQGKIHNRQLSFVGQAFALNQNTESLASLLSLIGVQQGDIYRLQF